jgi:hypothetical protein
MSLQFLHDRQEDRGGVTHALEVDNAFLNTIEVGDIVSIECGIAVCSPKDCYNKKTGRELAISRAKETPFQVKTILKTLVNKNTQTDILTTICIQNEKAEYLLIQNGINKKFRLSRAALASS